MANWYSTSIMIKGKGEGIEAIKKQILQIDNAVDFNIEIEFHFGNEQESYIKAWYKTAWGIGEEIFKNIEQIVEREEMDMDFREYDTYNGQSFFQKMKFGLLAKRGETYNEIDISIKEQENNNK